MRRTPNSPTPTAASGRNWPRRMLLLLACAPILTGCALIPTTPTLGPQTGWGAPDASLNPLCLKDKIIPYSGTADRPILVEMVREHNAVWAAICQSTP